MEHLFEALHSMADGVLVVDRDQNILFWNQAAEDMLGHLSGEVLGQPCYEILNGRSDEGRLICKKYCRALRKSMSGKAVNNFDAAVRTKWNGVRWVNLSTFSVQHERGNQAPVMVHFFRDATQKKQNEQFVDQVGQWFREARGKNQAEEPAGTANHPHEFGLTEREGEVLALLANGLSTAEIAGALTISPATARNHIRSILVKLNGHSRLEAVVFAIRHGLVR